MHMLTVEISKFPGKHALDTPRTLRLGPREAALQLYPFPLIQVTPSGSSWPPPFKILDPPLPRALHQGQTACFVFFWLLKLTVESDF